jgi:hypothetical protein
LQRLAALYRVPREVTVSAGSEDKQESETWGFGSWSCDDCSEFEQIERGCQILGRSFVAAAPIQIDHTGTESSDFICVCPRSLLDAGLEFVLERAPFLESSGGVGAHYGVVPADLPTRVSWLYTASLAVRDRWKAQLQDAQSRCQRKASQNP